MKSELVIYAGIDKSMGAIFSVTYGKDRVIMDFGSAFNPEIKNYIKINDNWIVDKLNLNLLPKIDGLYPKKYLNDYDLLSYEESDLNTAIFISHLHLDHMSNIGAVSKNIPIYLSNKARDLELALEHLNMGVDSIGRDYSVIENSNEINIGKIKVTPIINSTYSYKMYGYLIETPDLKIGYTADFSLCNEQPELVFKELEIFKNKKLNILFMDNCNFDDYTLKKLYNNNIVPSLELPNDMITHNQHYNNLKDLYINADSLVIFNIYEREMFDVEKIIEWSKEVNREVVFEPKTAYLVKNFFGYNVNIYHNGEDINDEYFNVLKEDCSFVSRKDILNNPKKYYLQNSYNNISELFKLNINNGLYIHANGDPFSSKEIENMKNIVDKAGYSFKTYDDSNYYQHGYPNHVKYFVDCIDPDVVIGYHGNHPERITNKQGISFVPKLYKKYYFIDKTLKEVNS